MSGFIEVTLSNGKGFPLQNCQRLHIEYKYLETQLQETGW